MRQREEWARKAIRQVGQGEAEAALSTYKERGQLHVLPTREDAERELVEGWRRAGIANPQGNLILAATNADVAPLNHEAQAARKEAGQLGYRSLSVGEERIHEGDRILFTDTDKRLGLVKSEFGTVMRIDRLSERLTVQIDGQDDRPVRFSLRQFDSLRLGYAATVHRAQGMTLEQDAYVLVGGSMQNREMTYVQISRAARRICSATSGRRGEIRASLSGWSGAPRRSSRRTASPATTSRVKSASVRNKALRLACKTEPQAKRRAGVMALSE